MIYIFTLLLLAVCLPLSGPGMAEEPWDPLKEYPHVVLNNGSVEIQVFLPDPDEGFYRSTRFDWSGITWQIHFKGHTYIVPRHLPHDPTEEGHGMGLAGEFCIGAFHIPHRFEEAEAGETFVKLGCGILRKPAGNAGYHFSNDYEMVDPGQWKTEHGKNWVRFRHTLQDEKGFGYVYEKRMELLRGKDLLRISNKITNTGRVEILQDHYNHNFIAIDGDSIGPAYTATFSKTPVFMKNFEPHPEAAGMLDGNMVRYSGQVNPPFHLKFREFGDDPGDGTVVLRNHNRGAGVEIGGDFPVLGINFWSAQATICPEIFFEIDVKPGETTQWTRTYRFFEFIE